MSAKRVAVVGAGPSGLAAARHFSADSSFECHVYEQGSDLGGTWVLSEHVGNEPDGRPVHSSMYKNLRTNLPKEIMSFPRFPFDDKLGTFLSCEEVLEYLHKFADHYGLRKMMRFDHLVCEIKPLNPSESLTIWELRIRDLKGEVEFVQHYDAVVVANGHNSEPYWPQFDGLEMYEGKILHSHDYRDAANYKNEDLLIIGGSFSALDILLQVAKHATHVTISHHLKELKVKIPENVTEVSDVLKFDQDKVHFTDGQSRKFDTVIMCTGFNYAFPFLHPGCKITTCGYGVEPLYKHFINIEHPTMCLLVLANHVSPLQLADLEVRFFKKLLLGESALPSKSEMYEELKKDQKMRKEKLGLGPRHAHKMGCLQKKHYDDLANTAGMEGVHPDIANYILKAQDDFCVLSSQCSE
ncbi:senecionine N-oxygenase-like [Neocloeon triangulifer]|uniref:senecionine N-oxygenase-like n=1 Tax=Neocloeon triangulifer TaxID=2078957 RepID=UPI00286F4CEF|nr:senecionine N-oxygenase-like [Neocloeon triangulifer]